MDEETVFENFNWTLQMYEDALKEKDRQILKLLDAVARYEKLNTELMRRLSGITHSLNFNIN